MYASRIDYIRPCVNTLIGGQAKFYKDYSEFYETILSDPTSPKEEASKSGSGKPEREYVNIKFGADPATDNEVETFSSEIEECLKDIKSLSIVASN